MTNTPQTLDERRGFMENKKESSEGIKKRKSRSISRSCQKLAGGFRGNMRLPTFTIFKITNP